MKHLILIIGIISSILQACQLTEVDGYVGGSSIYFSIQRDTMTYSWGTVDSDIQERVLELPIYLFGEVKDYDRKIQVRALSDRERQESKAHEEMEHAYFSRHFNEVSSFTQIMNALIEVL